MNSIPAVVGDSKQDDVGGTLFAIIIKFVAFGGIGVLNGKLFDVTNDDDVVVGVAVTFVNVDDEFIEISVSLPIPESFIINDVDVDIFDDDDDDDDDSSDGLDLFDSIIADLY